MENGRTRVPDDGADAALFTKSGGVSESVDSGTAPLQGASAAPPDQQEAASPAAEKAVVSDEVDAVVAENADTAPSLKAETASSLNTETALSLKAEAASSLLEETAPSVEAGQPAEVEAEGRTTSVSRETPLGPVSDTDLVRIRPPEKKQVRGPTVLWCPALFSWFFFCLSSQHNMF